MCLLASLQIYKHAWDVVDIERIKQATDIKFSADIAAVLIMVGAGEASCQMLAWPVLPKR